MTEVKVRLQHAIPACAILVCIALTLSGCESFSRKFTRKTKKKEQPQGVMVLSPEAYPDTKADKEDAYRRYFMYWSGWHDEVIDNLADQSPNARRQRDSIQEAINNLSEMEKLLTADKQADAARFLVSMNSLKDGISRDLYGNNSWALRRQAESLKQQISRALNYKRVKENLK